MISVLTKATTKRRCSERWRTDRSSGQTADDMIEYRRMDRPLELDTDGLFLDPANRCLQELQPLEFHPDRLVELRPLEKFELTPLAREVVNLDGEIVVATPPQFDHGLYWDPCTFARSLRPRFRKPAVELSPGHTQYRPKSVVCRIAARPGKSQSRRSRSRQTFYFPLSRPFSHASRSGSTSTSGAESKAADWALSRPIIESHPSGGGEFAGGCGFGTAM